MSKLIGISTGLKDVEMAPGNISCVVINNDFVKACNIPIKNIQDSKFELISSWRRTFVTVSVNDARFLLTVV